MSDSSHRASQVIDGIRAMFKNDRQERASEDGMAGAEVQSASVPMIQRSLWGADPALVFRLATCEKRSFDGFVANDSVGRGLAQ